MRLSRNGTWNRVHISTSGKPIISRTNMSDLTSASTHNAPLLTHAKYWDTEFISLCPFPVLYALNIWIFLSRIGVHKSPFLVVALPQDPQADIRFFLRLPFLLLFLFCRYFFKTLPSRQERISFEKSFLPTDPSIAKNVQQNSPLKIARRWF